MYKDSLNMRHALVPSSCLKHRYIIKDVLGEGGFGITYSGRDKTTEKHVAIKEYFPSGLAVRTEQADDFLLCPVSGKREELFLHGRQRFLNEAKILKEFQHLEGIVSVYDVFEENNTAYIVMEYIEGLTLGQYIEENGCLCFAELVPLITPVMQDLSAVHKKKLIHQDISPDNLILGIDNRLHLIDFGAASHENISGGQHTVILKAGYAPPEQYISDSRTGAWIDVYALCATMYFALTGSPPSEAIHRLEQESLEFPDTVTDMLPWQKAALEKGLHIRMSRRFCNMEELYDAIMYAPDIKTQVTMTGVSLTRKEKQKIRRMRYRFKLPLFFSLLLFVLAGVLLITSVVKSRQIPAQDPVSETASPQVTNGPDVLEQREGLQQTLTATPESGAVPKTGTTPETKAASKARTTPKAKAASKARTTPDAKVTPKVRATPKVKPDSGKRVTPKPEKTPKKSSTDYHLTPEDDDFVTVPLD